MPNDRDDLSIHVYAAPLAGGDGRALASIQALERAFSGVRLNYEISPDGLPVELPRRDDWLAAELARGDFPLLCNGDETFLVTMSGYDIPEVLAPGGQPQLDIHALLPLEARSIAATAGVLEGIADEVCAWWGLATPGRAAVEIVEQIIHPPLHPSLRQVPPRGLPAIRPPGELQAPEIPHRLGWLNYWSVATAAVLGFPDPARDASLLSRARRTATGAWILQLTDAPLDLDEPTHLEALLAAYHRFPAIGGRSRP